MRVFSAGIAPYFRLSMIDLIFEHPCRRRRRRPGADARPRLLGRPFEQGVLKHADFGDAGDTRFGELSSGGEFMAQAVTLEMESQQVELRPGKQAHLAFVTAFWGGYRKGPTKQQLQWLA